MLNLNISTILLQMANFFILAYILYRFLFQPLQNVLKKRETEITRAMDEAQAAKDNAEELRKQYEEKSQNIDAEIAARKNEARIVIEQTRRQMLQEVQKQIDRLTSQTEEKLTQMKTEAVQQHKEQLGNLAGQYVKNIFSDLMTPQLQKIYQDEFLDHISSQDLASYTEDIPPGQTVQIKAILAHAPSQSYQEHLENLLRDKISKEFNLTFEVDPGIIAGGKLQFENELIDGSVIAQIDQLQQLYQVMG